MSRFYVTTSCVNTRPDLEFTLRLVQADVLARHHRMRGDRVRFLTGTDHHSPANMLDVRNAETAAVLRESLALSFNDVINTGRDARHQSGVQRLWRACAQAGDIYHTRDEAPYFFRLSRYGGRLHDLISGGGLRIEPAERRDEVLTVIAAGLRDVCISHARADGWGIGVPGDPDQVISAWWGALGSSITSLGYGTDGPHYQRWWVNNDQRVHLADSGALRSHALHWPAMLLSAGVPLPSEVLVHGDLTTVGDIVDPSDLARRYGADAVRWWLLREVPRDRDTEFTIARLVARANEDLATGLGNLVDRVTVMVHRYRGGQPPASAEDAAGAQQLITACRTAPEHVHDALSAFDFERATAAVWLIVEEANRYLQRARPWELARAERDGDVAAGRQLDTVLTTLLAACRALANQLTPFLPTVAMRIAEQSFALSGSLAPQRNLFPRLRSASRRQQLPEGKLSTMEG